MKKKKRIVNKKKFSILKSYRKNSQIGDKIIFIFFELVILDFLKEAMKFS